MAHRIFLSYSSGDQPVAEAICKALEEAGIGCWIAPRDLTAASRWGGSIVAAIQASRAVLVVFSEESNASPQVAREMEVAVAQRLPLIPVRIADVLPTEDMQYFLGVSHWLNAFPRPIEAHLPEVIATARRVLAREGAPWKRIARRMPQNRIAQLGMLGGAVLAVALLTAWLMRPAPPPSPLDAMRSPMAGRWQAELADAHGRKQTCVLDVQDLGQARFSDTCPLPLMGTRGTFAVTKDGTSAPQLFTVGKDTGSFMFLGGSIHGMAGAFRLEGRNRLMTHDAQRGEVNWTRIAADTPLHDASADVLPAQTDWPLKDVPAIAGRAIAYARSHWQEDALLMNLKAELVANSAAGDVMTPAGGLTVSFEFYSPSTQQGMSLTPNSPAGAIFALGAIDRNPQHALPANFLDLPQAVASLQARGMRGKQIKMAELENWSAGTSYGSAQLSGVEWMIDSALGERGTVKAALR